MMEDGKKRSGKRHNLVEYVEIKERKRQVVNAFVIIRAKKHSEFNILSKSKYIFWKIFFLSPRFETCNEQPVKFVCQLLG